MSDMTTKQKPVTLFGRKMRRLRHPAFAYVLSGAKVFSAGGRQWSAWIDDWETTRYYATPHAAARALERKIRAAHKRLGKLIEGKKT